MNINFKFPFTIHKFVEIVLRRDDFYNFFHFDVDWTRKQDHAGLHIFISLIKVFVFEFNIYDHRHWDYENNKWENYDGENI